MVEYNSVWQPRRVLITKEYISFAFVRKEEEIDRIPLDGVDFVKAHFEAAIMDGHIHDDNGQSQDFFCLQVATNAEGYNSGRTYTFRTRSKDLYEDILPLLSKLAKNARRRAQARTWFRKLQWQVRRVYSLKICQSTIALIIMGVSPPCCFAHTRITYFPADTELCSFIDAQSFACTMVEAQYSQTLASDTRLAQLLNRFDILFTAFFALELAVSAFANWLLPFVRDPWSWLDAFVASPPLSL